MPDRSAEKILPAAPRTGIELLAAARQRLAHKVEPDDRALAAEIDRYLANYEGRAS